MPVTRTDLRRSPALFGGRSGRRVAWDRKVRPRWQLRLPSPRVSGSRARRPKREPDTSPPLPAHGKRRALSVGRAAMGKAIPYDIFDLSADSGPVNVGTDHDTAVSRHGVHPPLAERRRTDTCSGARRLLPPADTSVFADVAAMGPEWASGAA